MRKFCAAIVCLVLASESHAVEFTFDSQGGHQDILGNGKIWLRTITPTYDQTSEESKIETYKVFTHIFDFAGKAPITKGTGGMYTHHRGLFIGWRDTMVGGKDYDTWHLVNPDCSIRHVAWLEQKGDTSSASQNEENHWCDENGKPFIKEFRTIAAKEGENGVRVIDFVSTLHSLAGKIELKGDLQHAGMHLRLEDEVSKHENTTKYVLPDGAEELIDKATGKSDDKVVGAWWVMCSAEVGGKRYWIQHMTAPDLVTGIPVYSIRRYARFGSFFEPVLEEGKPQVYRFRFVVSESELTREQCAAMYTAYTKETPLVRP
jgi:hypothetical protein